MLTSMFCSTFAFSTFAQLGLVGTNQLDFAASANGASCGFEALKARSFVVLAMLPAFAISLSAAVLVNALIQSTARLWFFVVTGTARSEPPRKVGMNLPGMCLGIECVRPLPAVADERTDLALRKHESLLRVRLVGRLARPSQGLRDQIHL